MKFPRRQFLHLAAGAAVLSVVPRIARAQTYPSRPVRIIVRFAPGGGVDITARLIGQSLSEQLGQQFVVENRTGAGSNIGTEAVVNAAPDGYTLLLATTSNAVNATLYAKLNYDFVRDIAPVATIGRGHASLSARGCCQRGSCKHQRHFVQFLHGSPLGEKAAAALRKHYD